MTPGIPPWAALRLFAGLTSEAIQGIMGGMRIQKVNRHPSLWLALVACLLVAGCANAPPTPVAESPVPAPTTASVASEATSVRTVRPSASPSLTATATATRTPRPSPTATVTWTPSPTPTPSPTFPPNVLLEDARHNQYNGDYDEAVAGYLALLDEDAPAAQHRAARYGLAEIHLLKQDYPAAAAAWEEFLTLYPEDEAYGRAAFMAARAYQAINEWEKASRLYEASLAEDKTLADIIYQNIAECHSALAARAPLPRPAYEKAIAAYRQALAATANRSIQVSIRERIAGIYLAMDDPAAAVAEYDAILAVAQIESYRAKIEYLAGQALAGAGQAEAALERYRRPVDRYPNAEFAYLGLIELLNAGAEVDEFQRGLIDYHAGASYPDAYGAAIRAFDRYLESTPADKAAEALYRKALSQRALEQPEAAIATLDALIAGHPQSTWLASAWLEKGAMLAALGQVDAAVRVYQDAAAFFPATDTAPQALWRAARLRETRGSWAAAAGLYEELQKSFPGYEEAAEALWRAALARYRAGGRQAAAATLQVLLDKYPGSAFETKSLYWLGKLLPGGEGQAYWDRLQQRYPREYYALRVAQVRAGGSLTSARLITAPVVPHPWDPAAAEAEILPWLRGWTSVPTGTQLISLPQTMARRSDVRRAEALLAVNLRRQALDTFDGVRAAYWDQPVPLAHLAFYFQEQGFYGLGARAAARLAGLSPGKSVHLAPEALQRLAYPLPFADLISSRAEEAGLDPLLLAALVRQESLFEPVAESYAGARGLGQVMPATGEGIAGSLRIPDFQLDDLYRPSISIRFAAYYLQVQLKRFDDQILIALAAYNGGPGNTMRWLELGGDDLDLFVEVITASQSRIYLQRVYEQYLIYERLYRPETE
jgi:soluble lytic murein transglycosylase